MPNSELCSARRSDRMLVEYPALKVYMMHAGGGGPFSEYALMMMGMYPQLYADVGVLSWLPGTNPVLESFLREAKRKRMLDRVMFGSDQMIWPEAIGMAVERINGYDFLTVEEKAGIFYDNAARFLGWITRKSHAIWTVDRSADAQTTKKS